MVTFGLQIDYNHSNVRWRRKAFCRKSRAVFKIEGIAGFKSDVRTLVNIGRKYIGQRARIPRWQFEFLRMQINKKYLKGYEQLVAEYNQFVKLIMFLLDEIMVATIEFINHINQLYFLKLGWPIDKLVSFFNRGSVRRGSWTFPEFSSYLESISEKKRIIIAIFPHQNKKLKKTFLSPFPPIAATKIIPRK